MFSFFVSLRASATNFASAGSRLVRFGVAVAWGAIEASRTAGDGSLGGVVGFTLGGFLGAFGGG